MVPLLSRFDAADSLVRVALDTMLRWDRILAPESRGAAIYAAWERALMTGVAERVLPVTVRASLRTVPLTRVVQWMTAPDSLFASPRPEETRTAVAIAAFTRAVEDLTRRFGADMRSRRYGDAAFHHSRIQHPLHTLLSDSLRRAWSPGPLPRGGNASTLLATANADNQNHGASLRVVIDVGDWDAAIATNTPGQSGDLRSPFYANLFAPWAMNRFVPLPYSRQAIGRQRAEVTVLQPRSSQHVRRNPSQEIRS